ncbi:MAG: hypothetical protein K2F55_01670, partial [Erysipelotrichaceae bacterium]|nr:hypothetical protein [Erysipelotrichaceae bacterium]
YLSQEQINEVLDKINDTNSKIKSVLDNKNNKISIQVVDTNDNTIILKDTLFRGRGKNGIEFHWNYARIFIDAGNLSLALQIGFTAGTIYAPANIIKLVCGGLGIVSSRIEHGIWFDYNYFIGVLCGNFGLQ